MATNIHRTDEYWWREGIFYQIYPRSFQDSDSDGIGDIAGIASRLPYLVELGIDAIWLSPIFPSPMADFGYDVADYCAIDPLFGTMEQFESLIAAAHKRGLKVILDLVPNHTLRSPRMVHRKPKLARQPQTRLVHLARPEARRRRAQQLAFRIRRQCLAI
jgi:1,4-alpha-glucan branching enzyme